MKIFADAVRALAVLLMTTGSALGSAPHASSVPFQLIDNRMFVQARLNGAGPFWMIVDTGSSSSLITSQVAQRLHITARAPFSVPVAGSAKAFVSDATVATLDIGSARFRGVIVNVADLGSIRRNIGFSRLDGIIGYDLLRRFHVLVDMDRNILTLTTGPLAAPRNAHTVRFGLANTLIHVPITIDGIAGTAILDTGDRSSLTLFKGFADANMFNNRIHESHNALTGFGMGGPILADVLRTRVFLFGAHPGNIVTRAPLGSGGIFATSKEAGSVGTGLLKRFNVIYDYPHGVLIAWPSHYFAVVERYDPVGMWLSEDWGKIIVKAVALGAPADRAGLHVGDTIISVNGRMAMDTAATPRLVC